MGQLFQLIEFTPVKLTKHPNPLRDKDARIVPKASGRNLKNTVFTQILLVSADVDYIPLIQNPLTKFTLDQKGLVKQLVIS